MMLLFVSSGASVGRPTWGESVCKSVCHVTVLCENSEQIEFLYVLETRCHIALDRRPDPPTAMISMLLQLISETAPRSAIALYYWLQRVYQLLPPSYRAVWLEWLDAEQKETRKLAQENTRVLTIYSFIHTTVVLLWLCVSPRCWIRIDTIRDAILTCARKPSWVSLIYRAETTTKKLKTEKTKK